MIFNAIALEWGGKTTFSSPLTRAQSPNQNLIEHFGMTLISGCGERSIAVSKNARESWNKITVERCQTIKTEERRMIVIVYAIKGFILRWMQIHVNFENNNNFIPVLVSYPLPSRSFIPVLISSPLLSGSIPLGGLSKDPI